MRKIFLIILTILICVPETYAYSIKVYDEYGNRVGTYKKEGEAYTLYDFHDKKVEDPSTLIKNVPTQRTLNEYTQTFYDENMLPVFSYSTGFYDTYGRYYPRGFYPPRSWIPRPFNNSIVCPRAGRSIIKSENTNTTSTRSIRNQMIINEGKAENVVKTGFGPSF